MKISLDWLKEYVDIPLELKETVNAMTMSGTEVVSVKTTSVPEGVITCEIVYTKAHPDAEKLTVCTVSTGEKGLVDIVCGAPNCRKGLKTALAQIGTTFKKNDGTTFTIEKKTFRGVESEGILCSAKELGLGEESGIIIELPKKTQIGVPLAQISGSDTILDIEITPNRPDLCSHLGIAREVSAVSSKKYRTPKIQIREKISPESANFADLVKIEDTNLCPFYSARIITGIKIKDSPEWLKKRISSIGLRPINNVVDITNFVLHELGHPLHAFDLKLLSGRKIIVRKALHGEKMLMLDGTELELRDSQLVIADSEKAVALAGLMGGKHSGVNSETTEILLESAYFNASNIRRTSMETGLSTDSSYRFERGVDPEMVCKASDRATSLILRFAGGKISSPLICAGTKPSLPRPVRCRYEKINSLLGTSLDKIEMISVFRRLGFTILEKKSHYSVVQPPSYRSDIKNEADLSEEIARIYGLNNIPQTRIRAESGSSMRSDSYIDLERFREELISLGLNETMNYSLVCERDAVLDTRFEKNDIIEISNPLNRDFAFMRPSLLQGMIQTLTYNLSRKNTDLKLFEIGRVFCGDKVKYPEERYECCIGITGRRNPERFSSDKKIAYDFYDIKGMLECILEKRRISDYSFHKTRNANFADEYCLELEISGKSCAVFGKISEEIQLATKLKNSIFLALIDIETIIKMTPGTPICVPPPIFPAVTRDLAFFADSSFEHQKFVDEIKKLGIAKFESIEIFDEFRDQNDKVARKSLAYSITYRDREKTLTDEEVNLIHNNLREQVTSLFKVELR